MIGQTQFASTARKLIDEAVETQHDAVDRAADILSEAIRNEGIVHAFGTGHSRSLAYEVAGRAGGLIPTNRMAVKDLVLYGNRTPDDILDPTLEREPTVAHDIWEVHTIEPADAFVVASNSGRNGATVEMARLARDADHPVIAVTSMAHTSEVASRHPSGDKLHEVADVVLDNHAPFGDAVLALPDGGQACGISTITGGVLVQMVVAETIARLLDRGEDPPVYLSANVPGGDDHNDRYRAQYEGRIRRGEP